MKTSFMLMIFAQGATQTERKKGAWKIQAWTELKPWPLRNRCSAPPVELSSQMGAGHYVCQCRYKMDKPVDGEYMPSN